MKTLLLFLVGSLLVCTSRAEQPSLKKSVLYYADSIRKDLNEKRWSVEAGDDYIVIKSLFEMDAHSLLSLSLPMRTTKEHYAIRLDFKPRLPKKEYLELALARAKHATTIHYGTKTKQESYDARAFLRANPLPKYSFADVGGFDYSVYQTTSGNLETAFAPPSAYAEAKGVEAIVDALFWGNPE